MEKKILRLALVLLALIVIAAIPFGIYVFNDMFPMAEPLVCPAIGDIAAARVSSDTQFDPISIDMDVVHDLIPLLNGAEPTRTQSWNDNPTQRPYYCVEFQVGERQHRYYVFEDAGQVYVEVPYEGVYMANAELQELILSYFS